MLKNTRLFFSFVLFPALVSAADGVILRKVSGTVEYKTGEAASWSQAQAGAQIPSGGKLRTGADGRAEIKFKNKTSVWLKPSTSVALEQKGPKHNQVVLGGGSLKVRVPHLRFREKFEVKTPVAVASVRGTVFSIDDKTVQTFFGHVNMHMPDGKKVEVPQGNAFGGQGGVRLLSQLEEAVGLEDWSPGLSDEQRRAGLTEFVENRQQVRDFAHDAIARNSELVDALANDVKDADFAAGRTLTDVHGNLVRVEQRLDRPDPQTLQVVNITLRKDYAGGGSRGARGLRRFNYYGDHGPRVDALIAKAEFNMPLPDQITEFPGFFDRQGDSLKVDHASLIMANMSDPDNIGTVAFLGTRDSFIGAPALAPVAEGDPDDINSDLYVGTLGSRDDLFNLRQDNALGAGLSRYTDANVSLNQKSEGGELYSSTARKFSLHTAGSGAAPTDTALWVCTENYVINNAGHVRNVEDIRTDGINVMGLLSDSAGQAAVFVKKDTTTGTGTLLDPYVYSFHNGSGGDVLGQGTLSPHQNIDLVIIPDLFLSVAKTLVTGGDSLNATH